MLENSVLDLDTTQREENASNLYTADAEAMKTTSNHETSARGDARFKEVAAKSDSSR